MFRTQVLSLLLLQATFGAALRIADRATAIDNASHLQAQYDYVIVGGGTSGLTVAYRLTEDPSGKISGS